MEKEQKYNAISITHLNRLRAAHGRVRPARRLAIPLGGSRDANAPMDISIPSGFLLILPAMGVQSV